MTSTYLPKNVVPKITSSKGDPSAAVVIPCWNSEKWIEKAIQTVLDQNYADLDIIVIDDGSTDGSLGIIKSFGDRVRWETGPNRGACAARNSGLAMAFAEYVLFLDADDYVEPGLLAQLLRRAKEKGLDLVIGASKTIEDGRTIEVHSYAPGTTERELLQDWLKGKYVQTGALLWRSAFLKRIGGWDESVHRSQEIELTIRALLKGAKAEAIEGGYCVWVKHNSPNRLSVQNGFLQLDSEGAFHDRLVELIPTGRADLLHLMGARYYSLACQAFSAGFSELGRDALAKSHTLGRSVQTLSWRHRLGTSLFGLKNYLTLVRLVRSRPKRPFMRKLRS